MFRSAILPALAGYLFTYYNTKKTDERKAQIERINDQVRELYGPLLACISATRSAYAAMVRQHSPDGTIEGFVHAIKENPSGPEGVAYRHWMKSVLQPLNEKAADVIVNHLNLLESTTIHPSLLQFVAHVSSLRVVIKQWDEGSLDQWSAVTYPDALPEYIEKEFKKIKRRQAELLGMGRSKESNTIRDTKVKPLKGDDGTESSGYGNGSMVMPLPKSKL